MCCEQRLRAPRGQYQAFAFIPFHSAFSFCSQRLSLGAYQLINQARKFSSPSSSSSTTSFLTDFHNLSPAARASFTERLHNINNNVASIRPCPYVMVARRHLAADSPTTSAVHSPIIITRRRKSHQRTGNCITANKLTMPNPLDKSTSTVSLNNFFFKWNSSNLSVDSL